MFKSNLKKIVIGSLYIKEVTMLQNMKMLYKARERVIKWFDNYFIIVSETRRKIIQREELIY